MTQIEIDGDLWNRDGPRGLWTNEKGEVAGDEIEARISSMRRKIERGATVSHIEEALAVFDGIPSRQEQEAVVEYLIVHYGLRQ